MSAATTVDRVLLPADRCTMSGLLARPACTPRATVVALHGGGMNATYFHGTAAPELSLLTLCAAAGWNALSMDRPGYGNSADLAPGDGRLAVQADIVWSALDAFAAQNAIGGGYFLVGHSYGFKLALHLAAHERGTELLGVDGSGAARQYRPERTRAVAYESPKMERAEAIRLFWGPSELYPPDTFRGRRGLVEAVPEAESREAPTWPVSFPHIAAGVRVPVRITLAEHEPWWLAGSAEMARIAAAFCAAPVVETAEQPGSGHNISLGWAARSYHLAVLAFAERCLLRQRLAPSLTY